MTIEPNRWLGPLRIVCLTVTAISIAACTAVTPSTSAVASPEIACEAATWEPTASLTCGPAVAAAIAILPPGRAPLIRAEFHWGSLCPPGVPCAPPRGDSGYVIVDSVGSPPSIIYVSTNPSGTVTAASPAPLPPGY